MTKSIDIPARPTTAELHQQLPTDFETDLLVREQRGLIATSLERRSSGLFVMIGGCARASIDEQARMEDEALQVMDLEKLGSHVAASHRGPMHKPRSDLRDYQGEEQVNPRGAFQSIQQEASLHGRVSVEVRCKEHLLRYGHLLSYMWTGGRNVDDDQLMKDIAEFDPSIGVGVKNGLDGSVDKALTQVRKINELRSVHPNAAAATLIYRGGDNAQTPQTWSDQYKSVHTLTKGNFIVDVAHGSEVAHHPEGKLEKSVAGQIAAMEAVLLLTEQGYAPAGIMIEASDLPSQTDPHMPLDIALNGVRELYRLKQPKSDRLNDVVMA